LDIDQQHPIVKMSSDENGNGEYRVERTENILSGEPTETRTVRTVTSQGEPVVTRVIRTSSHGTEEIFGGDGASTSQHITQGEPTFITRTIRTTSGGESGSEAHNFRSIDEGDSARGFQTTTQGEPIFSTHTTRTTSHGASSFQSGFSTPSADARFERVEQVFASKPTFQAPTFGETTESGLRGETGGETESLKDRNTTSAAATGTESGNELHYGRDAAIGGTGSSGSAVFEGGNTGTTTAAGAEPEKDHHYGHDAALGAGAGAGGAALVEHEKATGSNDQESSEGATTGGILGGLGALIGEIGTTLGLTSENPATGEAKDGSSEQAEDTSTAAITGAGSEKDQNYGRDASVAAGGISAGGIAEHEQTSVTKAGNAKTSTESSGGVLSNQDQQRSAAATTAFGSETDHRHSRDAPPAPGTAAASVAALAHHERSLSTQARNPSSQKFNSDLYERPEITHSGSSTDISDPSDLKRTQTTKSMRERRALFEPIATGDRAELKRIASNWEGESLVRSSTRGSGLERRDTLAGVNIGDSVLDPKSEDFDPYKWSRMLMRLMDENEVIQRRAGIVWKNLKICGSGSAINLQKNVGSLFLAPLRFGEFFGRGPEKTILKEFEGVLKTGEMLVVLGRPGSGCSTLLKSLMGELTGLDMKAGSEVHYNGMCFCFLDFSAEEKDGLHGSGPQRASGASFDSFFSYSFHGGKPPQFRCARGLHYNGRTASRGALAERHQRSSILAAHFSCSFLSLLSF
jgi:hypothetical protein